MEQVQALLKSLRLGGAANSLPIRYQEAVANELDYITFLENLVEDEMEKRKENLLNRRVKTAKFPQLKTFQEFDFDFNPSVPKVEMREMHTSQFIFRQQNALFIGPPGVGKTHLVTSIGLQAIHNGYTVHYLSAFDLVEQMADALREEKRKKFIRQLVKYDLLIIDEFGMKQMPPNAADDMLELIHRRYGRGSTIIATNRPIEDWGIILGDNAATSAILDRFLHDAKIFPIKGKSYRMRKH